jgi:hypothetical protein
LQTGECRDNVTWGGGMRESERTTSRRRYKLFVIKFISKKKEVKRNKKKINGDWAGSQRV